MARVVVRRGGVHGELSSPRSFVSFGSGWDEKDEGGSSNASDHMVTEEAPHASCRRELAIERYQKCHYLRQACELHRQTYLRMLEAIDLRQEFERLQRKAKESPAGQRHITVQRDAANSEDVIGILLSEAL
eukprot:235760-Amphidinium_carterae.2